MFQKLFIAPRGTTREGAFALNMEERAKRNAYSFLRSCIHVQAYRYETVQAELQLQSVTARSEAQ